MNGFSEWLPNNRVGRVALPPEPLGSTLVLLWPIHSGLTSDVPIISIRSVSGFPEASASLWSVAGLDRDHSSLSTSLVNQRKTFHSLSLSFPICKV